MRRTTLALLGIVSLFSACGGRSLEQMLERHPAHVLPQGIFQVFVFRLDRLRENPLALLLYEKGHNLNLGPSLRGTSQTLQLAGTINRLVIGTYGGQSKSDAAVVALAAGTFDEQAFLQALEGAGIPHIVGTHDHQTFYTCGRGDMRCYVAFPSSHLAVAASQEDLLKRTLDLRRRPAKSLANDRALTKLLNTFSPDMDVWATGMFPPAMAGLFGPQIRPALEMIDAFTLRLVGGRNQRLGLSLHCTTAEAAETNAKVLRMVVAQLAQQAVESGYDIQPLLDAINLSQITVDGDRADYELELSAATIAATAQTFRQPPTLRPMPPMLMDFRPPEMQRDAEKRETK